MPSHCLTVYTVKISLSDRIKSIFNFFAFPAASNLMLCTQQSFKKCKNILSWLLRSIGIIQ